MGGLVSFKPFSNPGRFYKGNLHMHSSHSDGALSVADVCEKYRSAGYDFVSVTDHALERFGFPVTDSSSCRGNGFTTIIGAELHAGASEFGHMWHILANGLPLDFDPRGFTSGQELARSARDSGAFVTVAHPAWYILSEEDVASYAGIAHAIEIGNGVAGALHDRYDSLYIAELMFHRGHAFNIIAADDYHGAPYLRESELGWVWVKAENNEPEALVSALKEGAYYSSSGPMINDVRIISGKTIYVSCDPADLIVVSGTGYQTSSTTEIGTTEVELDISKIDSPYLRLTVRDLSGRRAWTNPIWLQR